MFFLHDKITTFCFEIIYFKYNLNEDNLDHAINISYYDLPLTSQNAVFLLRSLVFFSP